MLNKPTLRSVLSLACLLVCLWGCQPSQDGTAVAPTSPEVKAISTVPLRIWIVAPIADTQVLLRQWLAKSEQPLEFRSLTVDELLAEGKCNCDVLLYPSRLMGELTQRGWIVKLPAAVEANFGSQASPGGNAENAQNEGTATSFPSAWVQQSIYANQPMGLTLGSAVPLFVASDSLASALSAEPVAWSAILSGINVAETETGTLTVEIAAVDREALVDRYLAIVATVSGRDPGYGMLFDLQTMRSRLAEPEFLRAAKILAALASQQEGQEALLGSHSRAWSWAAQHASPALAIAASAQIDSTALALRSGQIVRVARDVESAPSGVLGEPDSAPAATRRQRPAVKAWNTGGGIMASVSANCRQSSQASGLLSWFADDSIRNVLATTVLGVESATPVVGADALSWKSRQTLAEIVGQGGLAFEPRLPAAESYRAALADELIAFLTNKKSAKQALSDADKKWSATTAAIGQAQRRNYEQSLNLGL